MNDLAIRLFVYGTLKRGYWNHDRFCNDAVAIEPAAVQGRLYELPSGIPVLEVPDQSIIAVGSTDIRADALTQSAGEPDGRAQLECSGSWRWIEGEVITLPDPRRTIPPIDGLEQFDPRGASIYRRVLVQANMVDGRRIPVWCYVSGQSLMGVLTPTQQTCWG